MLKAEGIYKSYGSLEVLKGISMEVAAGEVVSIVGASGAGKSTLLHIISTLDEPDAGKLTIGDADPFGLSSRALAAFRNTNIGFIFQFHNLLPEFTALENVMIPGYIAGENTAKLKARAQELLSTLEVGDRASHKPSALSGGEAQRVAVARALINAPKVVFADEPSGNLDSANATILHQLFLRMRETYGLTLVIVTHNQQLAAMGDRCLTMQDGIFVPTAVTPDTP